jgi:hypothetical protein
MTLALIVTPAKAGVQTGLSAGPGSDWIPAFAGMTRVA